MVVMEKELVDVEEEKQGLVLVIEVVSEVDWEAMRVEEEVV